MGSERFVTSTNPPAGVPHAIEDGPLGEPSRSRVGGDELDDVQPPVAHVDLAAELACALREILIHAPDEVPAHGRVDEDTKPHQHDGEQRDVPEGESNANRRQRSGDPVGHAAGSRIR